MNKYKVKITVEKEYPKVTKRKKAQPDMEWVLIASSGGEAEAPNLLDAIPEINEIIGKQWAKVQEFALIADAE